MTETRQGRIYGFDLARSLALLGMLFVNYRVLVEEDSLCPAWFNQLLDLIEGRAAATFVMLAGAGVTLLTQRAHAAEGQGVHAVNRSVLFERALFLFVSGLLNAAYWPSDILHFYGVYLVLAALLVRVPSKWLLALALLPILAFTVLLPILDFERGWEWHSGTYVDFWTPQGMIRHLFYNGCYPVFPWMSFMIAGMWLARQNFEDIAFRRKALMIALMTTAVSEHLSLFADFLTEKSVSAGWLGDFFVWFVIDPWEPMPLFVLSAGGNAAAVILICLWIPRSWFENLWVHSFVSVGQMALTLYIAHVFLGSVFLGILDGLEIRPFLFPLWGTVVFFAAALVVSERYLSRFGRGPLESVMRWFSRYHMPRFFNGISSCPDRIGSSKIMLQRIPFRVPIRTRVVSKGKGRRPEG
jgi:uncharacterized membrane protein YeiB